MLYILWGFLLVVPAFLISFLFGIIPGFLLKGIGLRKAGDTWSYWFAYAMSAFVMRLVGVKIHTVGDVDAVRRLSRSGRPLCFVSNHTSLLDIPAILSLRIRTGFVAKKELLLVPGVNVWVLAIHSVFINRKNLKEGARSIEKAVANIRQGYPMYIFPEGKRSKNGVIGSFKKGSFRLATESQALIVPITIKGLRVGLEDRRKPFQHSECWIHFGSPIQSPPRSDRDAVYDMIEDIEAGIKDIYEVL